MEYNDYITQNYLCDLRWSYQFNSLNFDSKKIPMRSMEDHLKQLRNTTWGVLKVDAVSIRDKL